MSRHDDEDDDYPNRFSSDYEEDDSEFDAADEPRRGPLAFAIALGILLIVSAVIWNAYRQGTREGGRDGAPRITVEGPAKVAPTDPGGETVPGQDVAVYDQIEEATAENSAAGSAASTLRPATASDDAAPPAAAASAQMPPSGGSAAAPVAAPAVSGGMKAPASVTFAKQGPFIAQIAALRSEEAANAEWTKLSRLAPGLFAQAQKDIQRADLGAMGVFYRLRVGSFATRADAGVFCEQLQAAGQGCIVATR